MTAPEAEEAATEALQDLFGAPASSFTHFETGRTTVSIFQEERPADWLARRRTFNARLRQMRSLGSRVGSGRLVLTRLRRESWADSWKKHFKPIEIGAGLLIKPSWSRRRARRGQAVIRLDPGLSFGTGQHPTTAFCLSELARRRGNGQRQSFLDIGTGSGILALAAARLGYRPVRAFDSDAEAVKIARDNARKNRLGNRIRFSERDVANLPARSIEKYSLVCANLTSNLLLSERDAISARLSVDGVLVLAGILRSEFEPIKTAYETAGLRMLTTRAVKEWRSASFGWRSKLKVES